MSLEGLSAVLNKDEVIVTRLARDFAERPKTVDDNYSAHLRTYVPMHSGSAGEQGSVEGFTKRFIQHTVEQRVPRGYITADFGYGKTSTGLFVWGEAAKSRVLAVPPFQLGSLVDLIDATAAWMHYKLGISKPSLQERAEAIHQQTLARSVSDIAIRYGISVEAAEKLIADKPQILDLSPIDIVEHFRAMSSLAIEAGFSGLIVIADEVQQYLEPEIKVGKRDPVGPLFDVVNALGAQTDIPFGLLLIIPQKEISVINDQRGDLIDRMRNYTLDLKTIYDQGFPSRLWAHLAKTFEFEAIVDRIMGSETLLSLGEIAVRSDLANGPRTVVNAFRRAIQLYVSSGELGDQAYTPVMLVKDFLSGSIAFDGEKRIQSVVTRALEHPFVRENPARAEAVLLAGAFPTNGVRGDIQAAFGLQNAFADLRERVYGDVVVHVGNPANEGTALLGLETQREPMNWLLSAIQDFSRNYYDNAANVKTRVLASLKALLSEIIFKLGWRLKEEIEEQAFTSAGITFEGAFAAFKREFPERVIHVFLVFDDEQPRPIDGGFDVILQIRLNRYLELDEAARQNRVVTPTIDEVSYTGSLSINLARRVPDAMNRAVAPILTKVVAPERLNPLFLLALHGYLASLSAAGRVPKMDQPSLMNQILPAILESALGMMLDKAVGAAFDAVGSRLVETLVATILRERYGTTYHTLMGINTWRNYLRDYSNALQRLDNTTQRQGLIAIEGTKEQIVRQLNIGSATALDTFMSNLPDLFELVTDFRRAKNGAIRFTLHPLEELIRKLLVASGETISASGETLHRLPKQQIFSKAKRLGYRQEEIEHILQIMSDRELLYIDKHGNVVERPTITVSVDEVVSQIRLLESRVRIFKEAFPGATEIGTVAANSAEFVKMVSQVTKKPDPKALAILDNRSRNNLKLLDEITHGNLDRVKGMAVRLQTRLEAIRLPVSDPSLCKVQGATYSEPLDTIRIDLLSRLTKFRDEVNAANERVRQLVDTLMHGTYAHDKIPELAGEVRATEAKSERLATESTLLRDQIAAYGAWVRTAQMREQLLIRIERLNPDGEAQTRQFEQIERDMCERLTTAWFEALSDGDTFERRMKALEKQVQDVEEQASSRFERLQDGFFRLLREIHCPPDRLWLPIVFSPLDQGRVYEQLYVNVAAAVLSALDAEDNQVQVWCSELRQRMAAPDGDQIEERAKQLISELTTAKDRIPYRSDLPSIVHDFDGYGGAFVELIRTANRVWEEISSFQIRVETVLNPVEGITHTPLETQLILLLEEYSPTADLADIWVAAQRIGFEDVWLTLRKLWEQGVVEIRVRQKQVGGTNTL